MAMQINIYSFLRKNIILFFLSATIFSLANFNFAGATVDDPQTTNYGLEGTMSSVGDGLPRTDGDELPRRVGALVGEVLAFVGILFFGLIIYAGFLWMTARGNEKQVATAKDLIINATIGLIVILAAYAITAFVGETLTKSPAS